MKGFFTLIALLLTLTVFAEQDEPKSEKNVNLSFKNIELVLEIPALPVKDQFKTSTCWSFSGISLLEAELIRMGKEEVDLSEMFVVRRTYERKADRFVRMQGNINFSPGGEANDVTEAISTFGILPETVYSGLAMNEENYVHADMDNALLKFVESLIEEGQKELDAGWHDSYNDVLDEYLGEIPTEFVYKGKTFTAKSFADYLDLNLDDYVMITSFSHQPFYRPFILEVPDNWSWGQSYNVPLDELEEIADSALSNGFTIAWAADASEDGFSFDEGLAIVPQMAYPIDSRRKKEKWDSKSLDEKRKRIFDESKPLIELEIGQDIRQEAFDNFTTTDDHGMHIVGVATGDDGQEYYYVKNSWGEDNPYNGYLYVSKAYYRYKTISIMLHKNAIPQKIAKRLSL